MQRPRAARATGGEEETVGRCIGVGCAGCGHLGWQGHKEAAAPVQLDTLDTYGIIFRIAKILLAPDVHQQIADIPRGVLDRVRKVLERLKSWPAVSGAKPLRHELSGHYRIRTVDYRIVFRVAGDEIWIVRIDHRKDVYES